MEAAERQQRSLPLRIARGIVILLTLPLWLPLYLVWVIVFIVVAGVGTVACFLWWRWEDRQMLRRLEPMGRLMPWDRLETAAAAGGTIVTDWPRAGWNVLRVWWTNDAIAQPEDNFEELADLGKNPEYRACIDACASPHAHRAMLITIAHGSGAVQHVEARIDRLAASHPRLKRVTLHSGLLELAQFELAQRS